MLGGLWLLLAAALLAAALLIHEPALLLVAVLILLTGGLAHLWARYLFSGVECVYALGSRRVFFGEEVTFTIKVSNRKVLPLPWVRVEVETPAGVEFAEPTLPSAQPNRRLLVAGLSLGWYSRVTRRYTATCRHRGSFQFGPAKLETGDMFGFFRRAMDRAASEDLLVYPRIVPLESLGIPSKELFGDIRVRRHLFEDPVRAVGTRDYAPSDPLRRVHWKTSARVGRLQSRVFEPTTSVDAALFLDTRTVEPPYWGYVDQLLELGVIVAASIASHALERDIRTGLYVNQAFRHSDRMVHIPPSSHGEQLPHILEALAQVHPQQLMPIASLVQGRGRNLPWASTIVVITAVPLPPLVAALSQYRRAGRRVALIIPGNAAAPGQDGGIPTYRVSDAIAWREMQRVSIQEGAK